jgi:hypothetical protein
MAASIKMDVIWVSAQRGLEESDQRFNGASFLKMVIVLFRKGICTLVYKATQPTQQYGHSYRRSLYIKIDIREIGLGDVHCNYLA